MNNKTNNGYKGWRPENRYLLSSDSDENIIEDANILIDRRKIPSKNKFKINFDIGDSHSKLSNYLSHLTISDRIDLMGHGNCESFENASPAHLALYLRQAGLREVGVIKFKSCDAGKGHFLEDVGRELEKNGVNYAYLSGAKGKSLNKSTSFNVFGKNFNIDRGSYVHRSPDSDVRRSFENKRLGKVYNTIKSIPLIPRIINTIAEKEKFNLRVVQGNVSFSFHGTRYIENSPSMIRRDVERLLPHGPPTSSERAQSPANSFLANDNVDKSQTEKETRSSASEEFGDRSDYVIPQTQMHIDRPESTLESLSDHYDHPDFYYANKENDLDPRDDRDRLKRRHSL